MSNLINWEIVDDKTIYDQLENKMSDYASDDFEFYDNKLKLIPEIVKKNQEVQTTYFNNMKKIDNLENVSKKQKFKMMLSYGVLVNYFSRIHERTDDEIYMLSACSSSLDLEDYTYYIGILSNEEVSKSIISKTNDFSEQINIAYAIMDSQDEYPYDFITRDNYNILVNNGVKVASNYEVKQTKGSSK